MTGAPARALELLDFALRQRGVRDAVLEVNGAGISAELIRDSLRLGGLGIPLAEMLCLLTEQELDGGSASAFVGPEPASLAAQMALMRLDRRLAHGALRLGRIAYPQEAALVRTLIDQLVADAYHDEIALRETGEFPDTEMVCANGVGKYGRSLHLEALRRGLIFRHLTPAVVADYGAFGALVSSPQPLRRIPLTTASAGEDFVLAAQGDISARDRLMEHLRRIGRSTRTAEPFLNAALARMRLVPSSPRPETELRWPRAWSPTTAPRIAEPLATVLLLGQKLAFAARQPSGEATAGAQATPGGEPAP